MKLKVVLGMSGGVDSSVAAALLTKQGYEVLGVTMQIWENDQELAIADAQTVAKKLNIEHRVLDFRKIFKEKIIKYFTDEYLIGKTPNPCIACNHEIKFGELLDYALSIGADFVATGHYAKIVKENDRYLLKKSSSQNKDQTYPLYHLTQKQLAHILFPLANYEKTEVRKMATDLDLAVANKSDSQDICFVTNQNYSSFIEKETGVKVQEGNFVDKSGNILGKHRGIYNYTIGQRKGLGIATGKPIFISKIDATKNEIVLGDEEDILSKSLIAKKLNFIPFDKLEKEILAKVKIRYGAREVPARIFPQGLNEVEVVFDQPQRAVTAGQSVVFYQGDLVLGGGVIC
ncbi:MAG: tRNA-specific 2-thiouridylase MnmA [Candidatus Pacebacteria bacterium GW2011_GWF2_38_9]|nr:MAG: tRNA-specific 2-thiouridylase MnmA, tRNA-specific 2-thiouridylase [candidate division TM6 bacterium GW2011_GWF2_28_16]KKQ07546.1 MAG: tRNA-specific 2-thiouridylase MnmA [Candidatus Pacebacteria bacterium GW2011_GWF1_36_5]KKQ88597.1 MAG: tRNA-specific 2-thiouridylase MnmA [Candidatus Pacebacteria bacterium GW2011_GWF2_38_9]HAZ73495.1 tRNA 2-thiouridine(34) synthase MnmA [Candidatus Paceibacterota bacterium]